MQHRGKKYYHLTRDWKAHSEGDCELCNKVATLKKEEGDQSEKEKEVVLYLVGDRNNGRCCI